MTETALWDQVKSFLKTTVPNQSTYDSNILPTRLLRAEGGTYTIETSEAARPWLERLRRQVIQAIAAVEGQPAEAIRLEFVANGDGAAQAEAAPQPDWTSVPTELLDFNPYTSGGYFAMSNYVQEFWGAYLGAPALQLLNYVRRFHDEPAFYYDKRAKKNLPNPNWPAWTPPRDFHLNDLVRAVKGTDKQVRGCWRTCHKYSHEVAQGVVRDACWCGLHAGELATGKPLLPDFPDGKPICHFWRIGLLDTLQAEELITLQQLGDPARPATVFFKIQVFQPLPLLTPWQVSRLPASVQDTHRKWLSSHGYNLAAWGQVPVERMMSLVKLYPRWLR